MLAFAFYGGIEFPSLVGDPLFSNLVHLKLCNCKRSTSLASLGQLPFQRDLSIKGMDTITTISTKFYRDLSPFFVPFLSLTIVKFKDMMEWKDWSFPSVVEEGIFPTLIELTIQTNLS